MFMGYSVAEQMVQCVGAGPGVGEATTTFTAAVQFFAASQCLIQEPWPPQARLKNGSRVDVVIVGGGTAGAALAARLSEVSLTVLLLEDGPRPPVEAIVPGFSESLPRTTYDYNYTTTDDQYSSQELVGQRQRLVAARVLGGGGSINRCIYARGFPDDYNRWARLLNDDTWNFTNVLAYFKKSEKLTDKFILLDPDSSKYHGKTGDIEVTGPEHLNRDTIKIRDAFAELGVKVVTDRNNPEEIGVGHLYFTIKDGKRQSTVSAMLNKARVRDNLFVTTEATVTRVLIENRKAYGVKVLVSGEEYVFYANKEVVISAGVYNTPKILMLSGVGPKDHLEEMGIEVVQDLPVGNNRQDHVTVITFLAAENGTCYKDEASKQFDVIKYLYDRSGSLAVDSRIGIDYVLKDSPNRHVPDFSIFPACIPVNSFYSQCLGTFDFTPELCARLDTINKQYELLRFNVILLKPKSKGSVRLKSTNIFEKPIVYSGTFSNKEDLDGYPEVLDVVWSLKDTSYFKKKKAFVVDLGLKECEGLEWPENVKCMALGIAMTDSHTVGTAAMGSVVDNRLKVLGVQNLRVVDASVMMDVVRGNTNSPTTMIADKAADFIKKDHGYCKPDLREGLLCRSIKKYY